LEAVKAKATHLRGFCCVTISFVAYFFPFLAAFLASSSIFASIRFGDLYGRFEVFLFGLNAIIRVIGILYINFAIS
jgi:hypothetical protein